MTVSARSAPSRLSTTRRHLLLGCALGAALAAVGRPEPARAQAFDALPTISGGNATFANGAGTTTITVNTPEAVIDWRPNTTDNPFVFLPAGNIATFQNGGSITNFAVLNRIITNFPSRFDGTVNSRVNGAPGGTVLFQGPGGIIVGPNALFDVGNLVLTTLAVEVGYGTFIQPDGSIRFIVPQNPSAAIVTEAGARIVATADGSWVALVAPRIDHGGDTRVNGSAAYMAMLAGSFVVNQGLFDIVITTGTGQPNAITHGGNTGGPASTGAAGDNHRIYLVAAPQGATTTQLLLGGTIGFDDAVSASVENGVVYLSSGANPPQLTDFAQTPDAEIADDTSPAGTIVFQDLDISSRLQGFATRGISMNAGAFNPRETPGVALFAGDGIVMDAATGNIFTGTLGADLQIELRAPQGDVTTGNARAGEAILIEAGGAIGFGDLFGRAIQLDAGTTITGGTATAEGDTDAPDDVVMDAGGAISTVGAVSLFGNVQITGGSLNADLLDAALDLTVQATGAVNVVTAISGDATSIEGGSIDLDAGTAGTTMVLTSTATSINAGTLFSPGDMTLDAATDLNFASADTDQVLLGTAGGAINFTTAGGRAVTLDAGTSMTGGDVTADGNTTLADNVVLIAGGAINVGNVVSQSEDVLVTAGALTADLLDAAGLIDVQATGAINVATATSGGAMSIEGGSVALDNGTAGTTMALTSTATSINAGTLFSPGDMTLDAATDLNFSSADTDQLLSGTAGGAINFTTAGGRAVTLSGAAINGGDVTADGNTALADDVTLDAASIVIGNAVSQTQDVRVTGGSLTAGLLDAAGQVSVQTSGAVDVTAATSGGAMSIEGGSVDLDNGVAGTTLALTSTAGAIDAGNLSSTGDMILDADTDLSFASAESGTSLAGSAGGTIDFTTARGQAVTLSASAINGGDATALADDVTLDATSIAISSAISEAQDVRITGGALTAGLLDAAGQVQAQMTGAVDVDTAVAGTSLALQGGSVALDNGAAGTTLALTSTTGAIDAGTLAADGDVSLNAATGLDFDSADAGQLLSGTAGGGISFASAQGRAVTLSGATITGGDAIALADDVVLNATGAITIDSAVSTFQDVRISAGSLTADLLQANSLIGVQATGAVSLNAATAGQVIDVNAGGGITAGGLLLVTNAADASQGVFLRGGPFVRIVTPDGRIEVRDADGGLAGSIELSATQIVVATQATIAALGNAGSAFERNLLLGANNGPVNDAGYLQAGRLQLSAPSSTIYVQNTGVSNGDPDQRRGFTANALELVTSATGSTPTEIFINGRLATPDGGFVTGFGVIVLAEISGPDGTSPNLNALSRINNCLITTGRCTPTEIVEGPDPITGPVEDPAPIALAVSDDLIDTGFDTESLLEEPVTSGSDTSLWECEPDEQTPCEPTDGDE
ncbi:MAG: beta strand repeat-containing protein [Sphingosinicella sp.]|uniref:beta strand repeat-containing protein n=1 Tax=Sphingosinicella sp. TaxID=1917971 RepID=UPI004037AF6D